VEAQLNQWQFMQKTLLGFGLGNRNGQFGNGVRTVTFQNHWGMVFRNGFAITQQRLIAPSG
jgi:hypothetical protein